ncbi:hypothetical protein TRVL_03862 [Trypanosoma vivax]|nr:hypothetical protein TRVL_03862 [Trypanosoma vivax]
MDKERLPAESLPGMTQEEVTTLLAEYGTSGPYDEFLDFPAISNSVFDYGGRDVFLTGMLNVCEEDNNVCEGTKERRSIDAPVDFTWPLECVVMRRTDIISSTTADALWDEVSRVLDGEEVLLSAIPRCEGTGETLGLGNNVSLDTFKDSNDTAFLNELDTMLREADGLLSRRAQHVDPMSGAFLHDMQRAVSEEERMWTPIHSDADTSDSDVDPVVSQVRQRISSCIDTNYGGKEVEPANALGCESHSETLFAFEFGPTLEEQQTLAEWDEAVLVCEQRYRRALACTRADSYTIDPTSERMSDYDVSVPVGSICRPALSEDELERSVQADWDEQHRQVLESISTIEVRDEDLHVALLRQLELTQAQQHALRVAPGRMKFEDFTKRMDEIIPPTTVEVQMREVLMTKEDGPVLPMSVEQLCAARTQQLQKRNARDNFRILCESHETSLMEEEDKKAMQELKIYEERKRLESLIGDYIRMEVVAYEQIVEEEGTAYSKLRMEEKRGAALAAEAALSRQQEACMRGISDIVEEHMRTRLEIVSTENEIMGAIQQSMKVSLERLSRIRRMTLQRVTMFAENSAETVRDTWDATQIAACCRAPDSEIVLAKWRQLACLCRDLCPLTGKELVVDGALPIVCSSLRLMSLVREEREGRQWLKERTHYVEQSVAFLRSLRNNGCSRVGRPPTPSSRPGTGRSQLSASGVGTSSTCSSLSLHAPDGEQTIKAESPGICLDAKLAKRLQPLALCGTKSGEREVAQLCHSISYALEQISHIDFVSLADLRVPCAEKSHAFVAPFVQELNLGSNSLAVLHLDELLRVFPSLRSLNVSDNKLHSIVSRTASLRGVMEAQAHAVAQSSRLTYLDVSVNSLRSIEAVGRLLSYHLRALVMFSNQIESLLPLAQCVQLECLKANRNKINSLLELKDLRALQTVDVSDNDLDDIEPLSQHLVLQNLYLSRNKMTSLPRSLHLSSLCQLFINENQLEVLPDACFSWLPLLTVLHAENNKLHDLSGLAHCPRLSIVNIAFNQLKSVTDLLPLTACRKLQTLSVIENPFATRDVGHNDAAGDAPGLCVWHLPTDIGRTLLSWFPSISELNNERVTLSDRQCAAAQVHAPLVPSLVALRLKQRQNETLIRGSWFTCLQVSSESIWRMFGVAVSQCREGKPMAAYEELFTALSSDVSLSAIQKRQDILSTVRRRRYSDALNTDEELRRRFKESMRHLNPVVHRFSDKVEECNRCEAMQDMQQRLEKLVEVPFAHGNVHVVNVLYAERARVHRETAAKSFIRNWLLGRLLCQKAKVALEELRNVRQVEWRRRSEAAARVIQALWRGAVVRSRVKRILRPDIGDDDENFAPVSLDFIGEMENDSEYGRSGLATALQRVLENRGTLPSFPISKSAVSISNFVTPPLPSRPTTAQQPALRHLGGDTALESQERPESQPQMPTVSSVCGPSEEWSMLVSEKLHKRQRKMERARRENMQREFTKDPLRVKRELSRK